MDHLTSFAASAAGVPAEAGLAVVLAFGLGFVVHACLRFGRAFLFGGGSSNGSGARAASSAAVAGPASLRSASRRNGGSGSDGSPGSPAHDAANGDFTDPSDYPAILAETEERLLAEAEEEDVEGGSPEDGWAHVLTTQGIDIGAKVIGDLRCMRGRAVLDDVSPEQFVAVLADTASRREWDPMVLDNRVIATLGETTSVAYTAFRGRWPVQGRDIVSLSGVSQFGDGSIATFSRSITHESAPVTDDYVRAEMHGGGFVLRPTEGGGTLVTFVAMVDLRGKIPKTLTNLLGQRQPLCINRIAALARKQGGTAGPSPGTELIFGDGRPVVTNPNIHPLVRENEIFMSAGVYDVLSAKLAERAGFNSVVVTGYGVAATLLGEPDFGLLTQTEILGVARRVCAAVSIPVVVDGDSGGGGALNVIRLVRECILMGASGVLLEDQTWPKRCGHMEGKDVVAAEEHVQKIRAAVRVKNEMKAESFMITARTDAREIYGLDEAIARAQMYKEAGCDLCFIEAPKTVDEIRRIGAEVPGCVLNNIEGGKTPILSLEECHAMGFLSVGYVLSGVFAAARALERTFNHIVAEGSSTAIAGDMMSFEEFTGLVGLQAKYDLDAQFQASDPA